MRWAAGEGGGARALGKRGAPAARPAAYWSPVTPAKKTLAPASGGRPERGGIGEQRAPRAGGQMFEPAVLATSGCCVTIATGRVMQKRLTRNDGRSSVCASMRMFVNASYIWLT